MIKIEKENIEIDSGNINELMTEAVMLVMSVVRKVNEDTSVEPDDIVNDIFKSLRYTLLSEEGVLSEDEIFEKISKEFECFKSSITQKKIET